MPWGVADVRRPTGRVLLRVLVVRAVLTVRSAVPLGADRAVPEVLAVQVRLVEQLLRCSDYSATENPEFLRSSTVVVCIDSMPSTKAAAERDSAALPKASLKAE